MARGKRILFIHPLGVNWTPGETDMSRIANIMAPLGLCGLASWVERHGHSADIHDCYAFSGQHDRIDRYLRTECPDYVGFTATTSSFLDAARIATRIKEEYPRVGVIFGGAHISTLGSRILDEYPAIDYGVVGEGEETLLAILEQSGDGLDDVPGLLFRESDRVVFTGSRDLMADLDRLPFPGYHKLAGFPERYPLPIFNYPKAPGATAVSSRGCPYQCSYCDRTVFGRGFRYNSAAYMVALMAHLNGTFGVRHVNFYDDLFTFKRGRVQAFCERLIGARIPITFNCAARAEHIDVELLRLLKRAGCWMISLGIETGDPGLLSRHRAPADLDMIREKAVLIKRAGLRVKGLFMLGLPGETDKTIDRSIDYVLGLPLDEFNLAKFTPFPGSPAYRDIRQHGQFDERWELMNCLNFVFIPSGITRERLEERYHEFYRRYFRRLSVMWHYLVMLWHSPDSWLRFIRNIKCFFQLTRAYRKVT